MAWFRRQNLFVKIVVIVVLLWLAITLIGAIAQTTTQSTSSGVSPTATPTQPTRPLSPLFTVSGEGNQTTKRFDVSGDFAVAWTFDCPAEGGLGEMGVDVHGNGDATMEPGIDTKGSHKSGTYYFHGAGRYYLNVITEADCSWRLSVRA